MNKSSIFIASCTISLGSLGLTACQQSDIRPSVQSLDSQTTQSNQYVIGVGKADVTGDIAENNMFGYADSKQVANGLQQRLYARAFSIQDHNNKNILMVVVDTGIMTQAIHQEVLRRLKTKYSGRFNEQNVMLTATHTHVAPGGYSHYLLYNLTTLGFQKATFEALVSGIMRATERALQNEAPATLSFGRSQLMNSSAQRSSKAFVKNPLHEQNAFPNQIDPDMAVLRFNRSGKTFAAMSFFAVHPTSLTSKVKLVSGDNKGYASYYWERLAQKNKHFIAAFPNTNPGDISPNLNLKPGSGPTENQWDNARILGERQAKAAINTQTNLQLTGTIDYRQKYIDMSRQVVRPAFTPDGKEHKTCPAAYKTAFAAGSTEDGGGGEGIAKEGQSNPLIQLAGAILFHPSPELIQCQGNKEIAVVMGTGKPDPWSPEVLPLQVVKLGQLALVAAPGEFTIASGRRMRQTAAQHLNIPLDHVLLMGFTNAYNGYQATPEEYDQQDYEGASTHFGPYTLPAWQQNVAELASALKEGQAIKNTLTPRDLRHKQLSLRPGVIADGVPSGKSFGDVKNQPPAHIQAGEKVQAVFWSAHPKNNLRTEDTFLEIQRLEDHQWKTVLDDSDWNTIYRWQRKGIAQSLVTIEWQTKQNTPKGIYRIVHHGDAKQNGQINSFSGTSQAFQVH